MLLETGKNDNIDNQNNDIDIKDKTSKDLSLIKRLLFIIVGVAGIFLISFLAMLILNFVPDLSGAQRNGIGNFITYAILFVTLLAIANKDLLIIKNDFKDWTALLIGVAGGILVIILPTLYTTIINLFYEFKYNENEQALRSFINIYPALSIIFLGIIGPMCEELTYRVGMFGSLRKYKWLAYLVSVLVFALMHFNFFSENIVDEFINLPNYIIPAVIFAFCYDKYGLAASFTAHSINNLYAIISFLIVSNL